MISVDVTINKPEHHRVQVDPEVILGTLIHRWIGSRGASINASINEVDRERCMWVKYNVSYHGSDWSKDIAEMSPEHIAEYDALQKVMELARELG